jgi:hypothetical protein
MHFSDVSNRETVVVNWLKFEFVAPQTPEDKLCVRIAGSELVRHFIILFSCKAVRTWISTNRNISRS